MTLPIAFFRTNEAASIGIIAGSSNDVFLPTTTSQLSQTGGSLFEAIFLKQLEAAFASEPTAHKSGFDVAGQAESRPAVATKSTSDADSNLMAVNPLLSSVVFEPRRAPMPEVDLLLSQAEAAFRGASTDQSTMSTEQETLYSMRTGVHRSSSAEGEVASSAASEKMDANPAANNAPAEESLRSSMLTYSQVAAAAKLAMTATLPGSLRSAGTAGSVEITKTHADLNRSAETSTTSKAVVSARNEAVIEEQLDGVRLQQIAQRSNQRQYEVADADTLVVPASEMVPLLKNARKSLADELASEIQGQLAQEALEGTTSIEFHIERPELGLIKVQISIANNAVSIRIITESETSRQIVSREMEGLRKSLTRGGSTCRELRVETASTAQSLNRPWLLGSLSEPARSDARAEAISAESRKVSFVA